MPNKEESVTEVCLESWYKSLFFLVWGPVGSVSSDLFPVLMLSLCSGCVQCIRSWLKEQSTCPTCRDHALLPDDFPVLSGRRRQAPWCLNPEPADPSFLLSFYFFTTFVSLKSQMSMECFISFKCWDLHRDQFIIWINKTCLNSSVRCLSVGRFWRQTALLMPLNATV